MQCIQTNKNGKRCTRNCGDDLTHTNYCNFHAHRFNSGEDTPRPFTGIEIPRPINDVVQVSIPFPEFLMNGFNERNEIDLRLNDFIVDFQREIDRLTEGKTKEERDTILFDFIIHNAENEEEQRFLIDNYERFIEIIDNPTISQNIRNTVQVTEMNLTALIQAIGAVARNLPEDNNIPSTRTDNLLAFTKDKENIYTKRVVDPVMKNADILIGFSKKKDLSQDTIRDVICNCKLTDDARKQLFSMYYSDQSIYNLDAPTYRLVLDGLHSYTLKQKEEIQKDIYDRLTQELEDNVGTCAHGNLSRLINVLTGFYEGFEKEKESIQDLMKQVQTIKDTKERLEKAKEILTERNVSDVDKNAWLELLSEE